MKPGFRRLLAFIHEQYGTGGMYMDFVGRDVAL